MKKVRIVSLAFAGALFVPAITRAQFADSVVSYIQGSGVAADYNDPAVALGAPAQFTPGEWAGPVDPFNAPYLPSQIVGLGAGGSITLQFNTPIRNNAANPFGLDFIIFGHAGFLEDFGSGTALDGSLYTGGTSDVRVSVSADGSTFYALNSLQTPLVDGWFPTDGNGNPLIPVNPTLTADDFSGKTLSGIRSLYGGSAGGAGFDIAWAVEGNHQSVSLPEVNFVRLENSGDVAYIDAISAVPEPATVALATTGASLLWWPRRKKQPAARPAFVP
jgi:hypothetical protein